MLSIFVLFSRLLIAAIDSSTIDDAVSLPKHIRNNFVEPGTSPDKISVSRTDSYQTRYHFPRRSSPQIPDLCETTPATFFITYDAGI